MAAGTWLDGAGLVLARGLLAGVLTGAATGAVVGSFWLLGPATVLGLAIGLLAGLLPAMVAAPAMAALHGWLTTEMRARLAGALTAVVAMTVWVLVLDPTWSSGRWWLVVGAVTGAVVGPWVAFGRWRHP